MSQKTFDTPLFLFKYDKPCFSLNMPFRFPSQIKLFRKLRYRKGFGVHSPFAYNLITKVIEEKSPYYVFEDIENFRKELLTCSNPVKTITEQETQSKNYGALLFRLVHFLKSRTILQIGSSTGLMSLYLALPLRKSSDCYSLEERKGILENISSFIEKYSLNNLHLMEDEYCVSLNHLKQKIASFDLIFINMMGDPEKTRKALSITETFIYKNTLMIIDNIRSNKAMKSLWQEIKNRQDVGLTIDLISLGLVFFNTEFHKQHYKYYFDNGKKQNLYEKRRRRFYFLSRRKKGV